MSTQPTVTNTNTPPAEAIGQVFNPTQEAPFLHDWPYTSRQEGERRIYLETGTRGKSKHKMRVVYQSALKTGHPDCSVWSRPKPDPEWHDFIIVYKPVNELFGIAFFDVTSTIEEMESFKALWFDRLNKQQQKAWNHVEASCMVTNGVPVKISMLF
jgi:hypothetical protein